MEESSPITSNQVSKVQFLGVGMNNPMQSPKAAHASCFPQFRQDFDVVELKKSVVPHEEKAEPTSNGMS